jgi:hypothetical protein
VIVGAVVVVVVGQQINPSLLAPFSVINYKAIRNSAFL